MKKVSDYELIFEMNEELPTQKQLDFIKNMEEFIGSKFKGRTKKQASKFISKHIEEYELLTMPSWCIKYL